MLDTSHQVLRGAPSSCVSPAPAVPSANRGHRVVHADEAGSKQPRFDAHGLV